jgi:hypothetical protein
MTWRKCRALDERRANEKSLLLRAGFSLGALEAYFCCAVSAE